MCRKTHLGSLDQRSIRVQLPRLQPLGWLHKSRFRYHGSLFPASDDSEIETTDPAEMADSGSLVDGGFVCYP